jgi:hypothetical protein
VREADLKYLAAQQIMLAAAHIVDSVELDVFIMSANAALSVGPILDPTMFRLGADRLQMIRDLAVAFKPVQDVYDRLAAAMAADEVPDDKVS